MQEICPMDASGRDAQEQCYCPVATRPVVEYGLLVACNPADLEVVRTPVLPQAASLLLATATPSLVVARVATSTLGTDATSTRAQLRSRGLLWPIATPGTVTLIFLLALAIAYYLYTHPKKK